MNIKYRKRFSGLDALRGIAVILMIEQHMGYWFTKGLYSNSLMLWLNGLGGMAGPLFISLAGLGSVLFTDRHENPDITLIKRGSVVLLFGYLLNLLASNWFAPGSWFVLHLIGFAMIITPLLRRLPSGALILLSAVILVATVAVQNALNSPHSISTERMANMGLPGGVFRLALAEGQYPVLPWLSVYITGMLAGRWFLGNRIRNILYLGAVMGGVASVLSSIYFLDIPFSRNPCLFRFFKLIPSFYPALIPITIFLSAGALLLVFIAIRIEQDRETGISKPLLCLGRLSLTMLIAHVIIFREAIAVGLGLWKSIPAGFSFLFIVLVLFILILLSILWRRIDYRYGAEWLLRRVAG